MSLLERFWDAFTAVVQLKTKVEEQAQVIRAQQDRAERLTETVVDLRERVARLEATINTLVAVAGRQDPKRLEKD